MSNLNSLNTLLRSMDTPEKLINEYRRLCPSVLVPEKKGDTDRDALNYCSGATQFVMSYLTGSGRLYGQVQSAGVQKMLDGTSAAALLAKFSGPGGLRIGYLLRHGGGLGHECVFAGSGGQWAFYQANVNGGASKRYTLAPKLNPMQRNWCINDMSERQFAEFFMGLTTDGYSTRLFGSPMNKWKLCVFSVTGQNLLA